MREALDAVIVPAAARAGCRLLLSEDLPEGFSWGGLTVTNPFASPAHPLLRALLDACVTTVPARSDT